MIRNVVRIIVFLLILFPGMADANGCVIRGTLTYNKFDTTKDDEWNGHFGDQALILPLTSATHPAIVPPGSDTFAGLLKQGSEPQSLPKKENEDPALLADWPPSNKTTLNLWLEKNRGRHIPVTKKEAAEVLATVFRASKVVLLKRLGRYQNTFGVPVKNEKRYPETFIAWVRDPENFHLLATITSEELTKRWPKRNPAYMLATIRRTKLGNSYREWEDAEDSRLASRKPSKLARRYLLPSQLLKMEPPRGPLWDAQAILAKIQDQIGAGEFIALFMRGRGPMVISADNYEDKWAVHLRALLAQSDQWIFEHVAQDTSEGDSAILYHTWVVTPAIGDPHHSSRMNQEAA